MRLWGAVLAQVNDCDLGVWRSYEFIGAHVWAINPSESGSVVDTLKITNQKAKGLNQSTMNGINLHNLVPFADVIDSFLFDQKKSGSVLTGARC